MNSIDKLNDRGEKLTPAESTSRQNKQSRGGIDEVRTHSKITDQSKTNKTAEHIRADVKLRQEIDDMDGFNNSEDEVENIDPIEDNFDIHLNQHFQRGILDELNSDNRNNVKVNLNNSMGFIDEEEEYKEEMKFQEAFQNRQRNGQ